MVYRCQRCPRNGSARSHRRASRSVSRRSVVGSGVAVARTTHTWASAITSTAAPRIAAVAARRRRTCINECTTIRRRAWMCDPRAPNPASVVGGRSRAAFPVLNAWCSGAGYSAAGFGALVKRSEFECDVCKTTSPSHDGIRPNADGWIQFTMAPFRGETVPGVVREVCSAKCGAKLVASWSKKLEEMSATR